jgi:DNA-directed RNA polymerase subunit RPC12/RpoP
MSLPAQTAEWNCTRCGTTNRKLVPVGIARTVDRCAHCRAKHVVEPGERPRVRWMAAAA